MNIRLFIKDSSSNLTKKEKFNDYKSFVFFQKILLDHLQYFSLLKYLDFEWDPRILNFFKYQAYFLDISNNFSLLNCLLNSNSN